MSTREERDKLDTHPIPTPIEFVSIVAALKIEQVGGNVATLARLIKTANSIRTNVSNHKRYEEEARQREEQPE